MTEKEGPGLGSPDQTTERASTDSRGNNSQAGEGRQVPLIVIPAIRNDEAAWSDIEVSPRVRWCGVFKLSLGNWLSGEIKRSPKPCNAWDCQDCAPHQARDALYWLAACFEEGEQVWIARVAEVDWSAGRLRQRRARAGGEHGGDHAVIERQGGGRWVFASYDPTGREPPTTAEAHDREKAVAALATALALPGVVGVSYSRGWQMPSPRRSGVWMRFGHVHEQAWNEGIAAANREAKFTWGVEGFYPGPVPEDIQPAAWVGMVRDSIDRLANGEKARKEDLSSP